MWVRMKKEKGYISVDWDEEGAGRGGGMIGMDKYEEEGI